MTFQGLYRLKPASQRLVAPIARWLVQHRVPADLVTLAGIPIGALGGSALALAASAPLVLLVVPVVAAIRLGLNLLDGMVARETDTSHAMGEMWNELGDRIADTLFIGGLAFHPGVGPWPALMAVVAALLASYAGVTARAAGGRRQYGGIMSKPGRMGTLALAAVLSLASGSDTWLVVAAWIIAAGSGATLVQRVVDARRELA